jgi:hypothetical protein
MALHLVCARALLIILCCVYRVSPKRSCFIVKKDVVKKCQIKITRLPPVWGGTQPPKKVKSCSHVHVNTCQQLPGPWTTSLDSRVGSIDLPSTIPNVSSKYERLYCTWTAEARRSQHYYIEIRNLTADATHGMNNGTDICIYVDGERRACQRGMRPATVPIAVTTTSRYLNITLEVLRGNAHNLSVSLMGSYKRLRRTTSVPRVPTTTSQPSVATEIVCYVKGKTSKKSKPTIGLYYYDHVQAKCIKYRRGHRDRANRYTGHGFQTLTSCRQQCVFNNVPGLPSVFHSSSGSTVTSDEVPEQATGLEV